MRELRDGASEIIVAEIEILKRSTTGELCRYGAGERVVGEVKGGEGGEVAKVGCQRASQPKVSQLDGLNVIAMACDPHP